MYKTTIDKQLETSMHILRHAVTVIPSTISGTSFCDKCSGDAYNRGLSSASEGCYNCACLDGSRQCGCQPGCPDIPAQPNGLFEDIVWIYTCIVIGFVDH